MLIPRTTLAFASAFLVIASQSISGASVTAWRSVAAHGSAGELAILVDSTNVGNGTTGPTVETRQKGVQKLLVEFNNPVSELAGTVQAVDLGDKSAVPAASATLVNGGAALEIAFAEGALADGHCYAIDLSAHITGLTGDTDCQLRALLGDVNSDGQVNLIDVAFVKSKVGEPVSASNAGFDLNADGRINLIDVALARSRVGGRVSCPLPPTVSTGTAMIVGRVFHTETGLPLEGAHITANYYPGIEGQAPLPGEAFSDANGEFQYRTVSFDGTATFLVHIRKDGFAEALRKVEIMAGRCWRVDDAKINPVAPPVLVTKEQGGTLTDPAAGITLEIPPGALQHDSSISITGLSTAEAIRDKLPEQVASHGTFVDVHGVFGDQTNAPVTMKVPNTYNLPLGTQVRFGKIDHNTLEWMDLRDAFGGEPPADPDMGVGIVKPNGQGGTHIEVKFTHFCTVCTGYCLPYDEPGPPSKPGPPDDRGCETSCCAAGGSGSGSGGSGSGGATSGLGAGGTGTNVNEGSAIDRGEGFLAEAVAVPSFQELGGTWELFLRYSSSMASPSITLRADTDYKSTRPVERTHYTFNIEGKTVQAYFDRSLNNQKQNATYIWDGRNGMGELMPTGSYPYTAWVTSYNANAPIAISSTFGGPATQSFGATYPGLVPLRSVPVNARVNLLNYVNSPYGAGWTVSLEERLHFDPDGCILAVGGTGAAYLFAPDPVDENKYKSAAGDFSTLVRDPATGNFTRSTVDGTRRIFTPNGLLNRIIDRFSYTTRYTYQNGLLIGVTSPTGYFYNLEYTGGKLSRIVDSAGRQTQFQIDAAGDLVQVTDPVGAIRQFQYDADHLLTGQSGSRGERSEYVYAQGRVVAARAYDVDGTTLLRERHFGPSALTGEVRAALAAGTGTLADPIPVVEERADIYVDGRGSIWKTVTSGDGKTVSYIDPLGRTTRLIYDDNRLVTSRFRPDDSETRYTYNASGQVTSIREMFDNSTIGIQYGGTFSRITRITDARNHSTAFTYDSLGRLTQVRNALDATLQLAYTDSRFPGLVTKSTDALGKDTVMTYDAHGRLASLADPLNRTTRFNYDSAGNAAETIDAKGTPTSYLYDDLNRLTQVTDGLGGVTRLAYGDQGCGCSTANVTQVTFANDSIMTFDYDGLNRQTRRTDQLGHSSTYTFDAEGSVVSSVNRNGEVITYQYDAAGALVRKKLPGDEITTYGYDTFGNLSAAANYAANLGFTYNSLGRLIRTDTTLAALAADSDPLSYTVLYVYDLTGNRTTMTGPSGITSYTYDELNRLTTLRDPSELTWTFTYDALNRPTATHLPNGLRTIRTYDDASQMTGLSHENAEGAPLYRANYISYNQIGSLIEESASEGAVIRTTQYEYDVLNRLTATLYTGLGEAETHSSTTGFLDDNRAATDSRYAIAHDDEGRVAARSTATLVEVFTFDADGFLRGCRHTDTKGGVTVVEAGYCYDPLGRRISKRLNHHKVYWFYDQLTVTEERDAMGSSERRFTANLGIDQPLAAYSRSGARFYHADRMGSICALSDESGSAAGRVRYDAYGNQMRLLTSEDWRVYYTAREWDAETGLYYHRARYYDPDSGRFISQDPIGLKGGQNVYAYAMQNPVAYVDPMGLDVYICDAPLKSAPWVWRPGQTWNPFHHTYLCVVSNGVELCGGQDRGGGLWSEGKRSEGDTIGGGSCREISNPRPDFEECVVKALDSIRPYYGVIGPGTNCQEWAHEVLNMCAGAQRF